MTSVLFQISPARFSGRYVIVEQTQAARFVVSVGFNKQEVSFKVQHRSQVGKGQY